MRFTLLLSLSVSVLLHCAPVGADETRPATLLVLNKGDASLAIVDPGTMKVIGRVFAGQDPHEVVASDDGKTAYVSNYGGFGAGFRTLSVVDLDGQKPLPAVDLGALCGPHGLATAAGKVYFTAEKNKVIGRYNPDAGKVDWVLGVGQDRTHMIVVSKDEKQIFTSNVNSDTISIIEKSAGHPPTGPPAGVPRDGQPAGPGPRGGGPDWTVTNVPVGKGPEGFDVSPDGQELWAANSHDGTISIVDVKKKAVVQTVESKTKMANRLKFSPDGKLVLVSDLGGTQVVVMEVSTRKELKRIDVGGGSAGILMQPDGSRVFVACGNGVTVIDLKTLEIAGRIETGRGADGLGWAVRR